MIAHCGFDFYFPVISDVEHVFMCLLAICMSSLGKMLVRPFAHFLLGYFFLLFNCRSSLYILNINHLSEVWFGNIFSSP